MKARQSGMPEEQMWKGFFDPAAILRLLNLSPSCRDVADFGCGYGTFTIPAARVVSGTVHAFDIEPDMVGVTRAKVEAEGLRNVQVCLRDFVVEGSGLSPASVDYVMLFNILHAEERQVLLQEAFRILTPAGVLGIVHWNYDPTTPRGPSMDIRPRPQQCQQWAEQAGFGLLEPGIIPLPPYHYGMALRRAITPLSRPTFGRCPERHPQAGTRG
ncbi:MAG: class I SAM-dependent methyltransferase [Thermoguttaceae bacterium]|jgi:SAM-dependent methyltransferase